MQVRVDSCGGTNWALFCKLDKDVSHELTKVFDYSLHRKNVTLKPRESLLAILTSRIVRDIFPRQGWSIFAYVFFQFAQCANSEFSNPPTHRNLHIVQIGKTIHKNGPPLITS